MNNTKNFVIRETNVDGCGGIAEVSVFFPDGLDYEEQKLLEKCMEEVKETLDEDTDGFVMAGLDLFESKTGKTWQDGDVGIIEF